MRILTFNLWHGLSPASPVAFEALEPSARLNLRESLQVEVIAAVRPDFCFFQEMNPVGSRFKTFAKELGMTGEYQPDLQGLKVFGVGIPFNLNSGLAIMAAEKYGLRLVEGVSLSRPHFNWVRKWASWQLQEERFALLVETLIPQWGKVLLVTTHLHHGLEATEKLYAAVDELAENHELNSTFVSELKDRMGKANLRRQNEMVQLLRAIKRHESRYAGVILCGDFNAEPDGELFHALRELGFRDAWAEAQPNNPGHTFDPPANSANHLLQAEFPLTLVLEDLTFSAKTKDQLHRLFRAHETRPRRIDQIWIRSRDTAVDVRGAELIGHPNAEGLAPSDHFGVCVDFGVKGYA